MDQQQFEQQKHQMQIEVKILNEQVIKQRETISDLQQKNQSLNQSHAVLEKNHAEIQAGIEKLKNKLQEAENANSEYLQSSKHWQNQFKKMKTALENKMSKFILVQGEKKAIVQQLSDQKLLLREAQDQNKLLTSEKWSLVQEKAQLEGQLKHMQKVVTA